MAHAVDADAQAIAESVQDEHRQKGDRHLALQMSGQSPDEVPPPYAEMEAAASVSGDGVSSVLWDALRNFEPQRL